MTPDERNELARYWGLGRHSLTNRPWFRTPVRTTEVREVRYHNNNDVVVEFWLAAGLLPPCYQCFMRPANVSGHDLIGWVVYGLKPGRTEFQTVWAQSQDEGFEAIESFLHWALRDAEKHKSIVYEGGEELRFRVTEPRGFRRHVEHWDTETPEAEEDRA
jgi:hypothetical protein